MSEKVKVAIPLMAEIIICNKCGVQFVLYAVFSGVALPQVDDTVPMWCPYCGSLTGGKKNDS